MRLAFMFFGSFACLGVGIVERQVLPIVIGVFTLILSIDIVRLRRSQKLRQKQNEDQLDEITKTYTDTGRTVRPHRSGGGYPSSSLHHSRAPSDDSFNQTAASSMVLNSALHSSDSNSYPHTNDHCSSSSSFSSSNSFSSSSCDSGSSSSDSSSCASSSCD